MITINDHGIIQNMNPAAEKKFLYTQQELKGENIKKLMPTSYAKKHDGHLKAYKETGIASIIGSGRELVGKKKSG